jgi:outer membrane protein OmpA-like peptidoglycan-associated protein
MLAEVKRMFSRISVRRFLALVFAVSMALALAAQDTAKPTAKKTTADDTQSKWDIFAGYSFLSPHGTVQTHFPSGTTVESSYHRVSLGEIFSAARYFNKYVGVQAELGLHEWGIQNSNPPGLDGTKGNNDGFTTIAGGLILRNPVGKYTPFIHVVGGGALVDGPAHNPYTWGPSVAFGGGVDRNLNTRWALRLIQADYEFMRPSFSASLGGPVNISAARLSAGIVYHASSVVPPPPVTLICSASPNSIFAGDPVTVTAVAGNLNPKLDAIYSLSAPGLKSHKTTDTVATSALAAGTYTVNCGVREGKVGKEGLKPGESADATASFTVKAFEPPTVSCSASPSTIKPGETSTVTAAGVSPQNRPLTYSYTATAGTVSGNGSTAVYNSAGAPTGSVSIPCVVTDDFNQTATSTASVTILPPYVPPVPHTKVLCSVGFNKDKKRPTRVDNEAKACLDEVALDLQKQPDSTIVLVGSADAREKARTAKEQKAALRNKHLKVEDSAALRAVNTKDYLVKEKGIDASRITVATSPTDDQNVEDYLVPAGANFTADVPKAAPVNESVVKPVTRKPLGKPAAHKKAAKSAK